jgi:hypothetical protein
MSLVNILSMDRSSQESPDFNHGECQLRDVKQEHVRLLKERFDNVLHQWLDEFGYKPNFWTVVDVEKIKIN